ncbi:hypothetical protein BZA77DRAFT_292115 [Pyronema omphalodes]|nr:hypothetical protein BZA77DRAFT_292115 [Pyronema omphalodes]
MAVSSSITNVWIQQDFLNPKKLLWKSNADLFITFTRPFTLPIHSNKIFGIRESFYPIPAHISSAFPAMANLNDTFSRYSKNIKSCVNGDDKQQLQFSSCRVSFLCNGQRWKPDECHRSSPPSSEITRPELETFSPADYPMYGQVHPAAPVHGIDCPWISTDVYSSEVTASNHASAELPLLFPSPHYQDYVNRSGPATAASYSYPTSIQYASDAQRHRNPDSESYGYGIGPASAYPGVTYPSHQAALQARPGHQSCVLDTQSPRGTRQRPTFPWPVASRSRRNSDRGTKRLRERRQEMLAARQAVRVSFMDSGEDHLVVGPASDAGLTVQVGPLASPRNDTFLSHPSTYDPIFAAVSNSYAFASPTQGAISSLTSNSDASTQNSGLPGLDIDFKNSNGHDGGQMHPESLFTDYTTRDTERPLFLPFDEDDDDMVEVLSDLSGSEEFPDNLREWQWMMNIEIECLLLRYNVEL